MRSVCVLMLALICTAYGYDEDTPFDSADVFEEWRPAGPIETVVEQVYERHRAAGGGLDRNKLWRYQRVHRFDREGRLTRYTFELRTMGQSKDVGFQYDAAGNVVLVERDLETNRAVGNIGARYAYRRNHAGLLVEFTRTDPNGYETDRVVLSYDGWDRCMRWEKNIVSGDVDKNIWRYSPSGLLVEELDLDNDQVQDRNVFVYEDTGLLKERLDYGSDGSLERRRHNYRYDSHGNWVYYEEDGEHGDVTVAKRSITYWDDSHTPPTGTASQR